MSGPGFLIARFYRRAAATETLSDEAHNRTRVDKCGSWTNLNGVLRRRKVGMSFLASAARSSAVDARPYPRPSIDA